MSELERDVGSMIRVLIADDHPAVRAGLAGELERQPDITVVGQAADADETLRLAQEVQPDVVLLDIVMPGMRAGELVRRLRRACPALRVLVLTAYAEEPLVLGLLRAGAQGYLRKEEELATVAAAVRGVMRGEMPLSPAVAAKVREIVITSAEDTTIPPAAQRRLAEGIPDAQQIVIPGSGHAVILDNPVAFNATLLAFLEAPAAHRVSESSSS